MKHKGGNETKGGFYWKKRAWEIVTVEGKTGTLPGDEKSEYLKIHGLLLLPVALVISIAYVVFLPVVGFAMIFGTLFKKIGGVLVRKSVPKQTIENGASAGQHR